MENFDYKSVHLVQDDDDTVATIIKLISNNRWEFYKMGPSPSGVGTEIIFKDIMSARVTTNAQDDNARA